MHHNSSLENRWSIYGPFKFGVVSLSACDIQTTYRLLHVAGVSTQCKVGWNGMFGDNPNIDTHFCVWNIRFVKIPIDSKSTFSTVSPNNTVPAVHVILTIT